MRYNLSDDDMAMMTKYWFDLWEHERELDAQAIRLKMYLQRIESGELRPKDTPLWNKIRRYLFIEKSNKTEDIFEWLEIIDYLDKLGIIDKHKSAIDKSKREYGILPPTADIVQNVVFWTPRTPEK